MKARCVRGFYDKQEKVTRREGDLFEVSEKRLADINSRGFGVLAEKAGQPKRTARRKKPEQE